MATVPHKVVIIIAGPTAVGKTGVGIELASHFGTEIISADSRQCFKELLIGVARPSPSELQHVRHHFIATHSIHEEVTAAVFEQYALKKTQELFQAHDIVFMVGGTGLYINAFTDGLHAIPGIDPGIREQITRSYKEKGLAWLQEQLRQKDPAFYESGEMQNPQRMMRALEVMESTGDSILSFRNSQKATRDFSIIKIGLELPKDELQQHIDQRVNEMMEAGLLEETKALLSFKECNALQTVGYSELFDHLAGKSSVKDAVVLIRLHTRQYAKRQMTWFKKDKDMRWFGPGELKKIIDHIALSMVNGQL